MRLKELTHASLADKWEKVAKVPCSNLQDPSDRCRSDAQRPEKPVLGSTRVNLFTMFAWTSRRDTSVCSSMKIHEATRDPSLEHRNARHTDLPNARPTSVATKRSFTLISRIDT